MNQSEPPISTIANEKLFLFVLALASFTHMTDITIIIPLGGVFMKSFEITPQEFAVIVSSYKFSAAITGLIGATFIDRFDRKKALLVVYLGFLLGTTFCALAGNYELLLIARAITGGFAGLITALVISTIGDAIPYERRGAAMGIVMTSISAASVVGVPFGLYLVDLYNWTAPFFFLSLCSLIVVICMYFMLPEMKGHLLTQSAKPHPLKIIQSIAVNPIQRNALLLELILYLGPFIVIIFMTPYFLNNVGFEQKQIKYIFLAGGILTVITSPIIGRLADKFGKFPLFFILAILVLIPSFLITHLPKDAIIISLIISTTFIVLVSGRFVPTHAIVTSLVEANSRGGFMSINSSLQQMGSGIASILIGMIVVESPTGQLENYSVVGYISVLLGLVAILLAKSLQAHMGLASKAM